MQPSVLVLGSGPIRIGQGIEFDYSCVHCAWALQELGYRAILLNNNPETVSTDFDTGDALYFEPVTFESVQSIVRREHCVGVMTQFGGQTAINLADRLDREGIRVLGTSADSIARAEDRGQFEGILEKLGIRRPSGFGVRSLDEAVSAAHSIGFPVLIRPSFVLGGRAMQICYDEPQLREYYADAVEASTTNPVLVDRFLPGTEVEVDVVSDGEDTFVPGILEHIERAGVHSGDSMAIYPPMSVDPELRKSVVSIACKLATEFQIRGLMNIQFVIADGKPYVLEVNPRASRTVPYISKVTGIPVVSLATRCSMGITLREMGYASGLWHLDASAKLSEAHKSYLPSACGRILSLEGPPWDEPAPLFAVKAPVFSFQKLSRVEPSLGPEMKSTGEILGVDFKFKAALYKALVASGVNFKPHGFVVLSLSQDDKLAGVEIARKLRDGGYVIAATPGTHRLLDQQGIESTLVQKIQDGSPNLMDLIRLGQVSLMINSPENRLDDTKEAAQIRRACIESGVACITNIDTAQALVEALEYFRDPSLASCLAFDEYWPGRVN